MATMTASSLGRSVFMSTAEEVLVPSCGMKRRSCCGNMVAAKDWQHNRITMRVAVCCSDILESAQVLEANNFEDSPLPVENSATLDGVALSRSCID